MRQAWLGTVAANGILLLGGMTTGILAARLLGPEERGLLAAVLFWPSILAELGRLGIGEAILWRSARPDANRPTIVVSALVLAGFISVMMALIGAGLFPGLFRGERREVLGLATALAALWLPIVNLNAALEAADRAAHRFTRVNLLRIGPNGFYLVGILGLWATASVSVATMAWAVAGGTLVTFALRLATALNEFGAAPRWAEIRALARAGARFHAGSVAALVASQIDRIVLLLAFPDVAVGHYVVAWTFAASGLSAVTSAVSFVLIPYLTNEADRERARALLALALRRTALFLYFGVAASVLVTPWLLPLLFGKAFADAVPIAVLLLFTVVPLTLRQTIVRCLQGFGEARIAVTSEFVVTVAFVLASMGLLRILGLTLEALAMSTVVANLVGLAWSAIYLCSHHGIRLWHWLVPSPAAARDFFAAARKSISPN